MCSPVPEASASTRPWRTACPSLPGYADGSADDLVRDGKNGFRLREGSAAELAEKLGAVLDDPERAARMGSVSRDWITSRFSFEAFLERVESALGRL